MQLTQRIALRAVPVYSSPPNPNPNPYPDSSPNPNPNSNPNLYIAALPWLYLTPLWAADQP
jgi:hypothetical protein